MCIHGTIGKTSHRTVLQKYVREKRWKVKKKNKLQILTFQELRTASCWSLQGGCIVVLGCRQVITMELRSALSTSSEASLLSKHITYSIIAVSQGSVIRPSLVNPNSSDILRSSPKTVVCVNRPNQFLNCREIAYTRVHGPKGLLPLHIQIHI